MSFVSTIRQWDDGVAHADRGDLASALKVLAGVEDINSKIFFNIGCLNLINEDLDAAEKAFDDSIRKDEHLAVSFFQRGITFYKKLKFEESLGDFRNAFTELRGNQLIDYNPLGLRYKLYACEVLHNVALTYAQLGQWEKAQENLLTALSLKTEAKHGHIDQALESKQKLFDLVQIQPGALFRPNKHVVAELEKKDYLGKAKVVASIIPKDDFSGFAPLQPQVEEVPTRQRTPEVLRALEGKPHSVLYEFLAETDKELTVLPGNIVFVLQKGADNWATVFFNGKAEDGNPKPIPAPPRAEPPSRPEDTADPSQKPKGPNEENEMCIVKVQFAYTVAICTEIGLPYSAVLQKISKKLNQPMQAITLRTAACDRVNVDEVEMQNVWRSLQGGRVTLWCSVSEDKENMLHSLVAIHTYEGAQPEDLQFCKGDVITVLSKVNEHWLEGACNGKVGIFPACFVE
ncbi:hypothetical protein JZ751_013992 [Albula glossodonta]|uniref:SH3 domain-containing protein n=1 Tax=Albula glossodonta TaxID=121402 RepID=A0A8T2MYZ1_9TELE|nr:hypothetical protein JZ751_013992 [Albula glossodonta]